MLFILTRHKLVEPVPKMVSNYGIVDCMGEKKIPGDKPIVVLLKT